MAWRSTIFHEIYHVRSLQAFGHTGTEGRCGGIRSSDVGAISSKGWAVANNSWRNFSAQQVHVIQEELPPIGTPRDAGRCPSCGENTLHWYHYANLFRARSKVSYVWCSGCRLYIGSTTAAELWDLPDPLGDLTSEARTELEKDREGYFSRLDQFWRSGALPQVKPPDLRRV